MVDARYIVCIIIVHAGENNIVKGPLGVGVSMLYPQLGEIPIAGP